MDANKATILNYKHHLVATGKIAKCTGVTHLCGNTYYVKYGRRTKQGYKYVALMLDHKDRLAYKQYPDATFIKRFKEMDKELRTEHQVKHLERLRFEAILNTITD